MPLKESYGFGLYDQSGERKVVRLYKKAVIELTYKYYSKFVDWNMLGYV